MRNLAVLFIHFIDVLARLPPNCYRSVFGFASLVGICGLRGNRKLSMDLSVH
jgi:hypothetical protein